MKNNLAIWSHCLGLQGIYKIGHWLFRQVWSSENVHLFQVGRSDEIGGPKHRHCPSWVAH